MDLQNPDNNTDKIQLLNSAIESFNKASQKFGEYYSALEIRVEELDLELKEKNEELKLNLEEKEKVKNYLNNILESLSTGVVVVDQKGRINTFNQAAEKITGLQLSDMMGQQFDLAFPVNFFKDLNLRFNRFRKFQENTEFETELVHNKKGLISATVSISFIKALNGKDAGIVLTIRDITRLKRLEKVANRAGRLSAMGKMAVKIAHEIRNPLGSIELFAGVLKRDLEGFEELKTLAGYISTGVKNINNIVSNMLLFVKPDQVPDFEDIDIHNIINEALVFSDQITNSDKVDVIKKFTDTPFKISGDSGLLKQVFLNLILNAAQAIKKRGTIKITTENITGASQETKFFEIRLSDTGSGISAEDMPGIFDPFFTTRKKGTGLGLAITHNIIKAHKGVIDITSSNCGTECVITLPST